MKYAESGVQYPQLDSFKRLAQQYAAKTGEGIRGESAFVWQEQGLYRAMVIEGLGTKNLVADAMRPITDKTYYDAIAQDTVAMIVNDLITVGAMPEVINAYCAVGDSAWFADTKRSRDLAAGWARACKASGAVWGGGETPTLSEILLPNAIDLAGSAVGSIFPASRLVQEQNITPGDAIVLIESSGIHANGLSLARALAKILPDGYATKLPDGSLYGEALLQPTHLYVSLIRAIQSEEIPIHYLVNITGHGWRKLMRPKKAFSYVIESVPVPQPLFHFIQHEADVPDNEMYGTFNMGAGFAIYVSNKYAAKAIQIASTCHLAAWRAGYVVKGEKKVVITPKNITFAENSLLIR